MKMQTLSKKTLAILLSLAMLMSCMVWSGVSAETIGENNFPLTFTGFESTYNKNNLSNNERYGTIGAIKDTGDAAHGLAASLGFRYTTATTEPSAAGVHVYKQDTKARFYATKGLYYLVTFDYLVQNMPVPGHLTVGQGSCNWDLQIKAAIGNDVRAAVFSEPITEAQTAWSTVTVLVYAGANNGIHIGLFSDDITDAGAQARAGAEVWIDNVNVQEAVTFTLNYNDNGTTANQVVGAVAGEALTLPTPTRLGYTFEGWFDADGNAAPATAPAASTVYKAKWAEVDYGETFGDIDFSMSFDQNATEITNYYATDKGAGGGQKIEITDSGDEAQGKAIKLTYPTVDSVVASKNSSLENLHTLLSGFRLADETNTGVKTDGTTPTLNSFAASAGTIYKVTFKYKADAIKSGEIYFRLYNASIVWNSRTFNSGKNTYVDAEAVLTSADADGIWKEATAYIRASSDNALHLAVYSTAYRDNKNTTLWIDDVRVRSVTCDNFVTLTRNMNASEFSDASAVIGLPGRPLVMEWYDRNGYTLDGWYTDSTYTTKAGNNFPAESGTIYAKWTTKLETYRTGMNTQTFEEADALSDFILQSARYTGITTETNHTVLGSKAICTTGMKFANSQRQRPRIVLKTGDAKTAENVTVNAGDSVTVSFWVKGNRDMNGTFTFYLATVDAEVAAQAIKSTSSTTFTKANGSKVSDVHQLQVLASGNVGKPYKGGYASSWGVGNEVAGVSLPANTWTYCEAKVSSIVLHGTDTNYLTLGYNYTGCNNDNTWALYMDDITVDVSPRPANTDENVQSFANMTAGRTDVAPSGTAYIVENGTTYTDADNKSQTLTVQTASDNKAMLAHLNNWGGDARTQVPVYGADGNQYQMKKGHVYDVSFKFMVPYNQNSALTYVHNSAQRNKIRNTITLNYWLMGSASAATAITGHSNAEYAQANEVYAAGMWHEVSARFVCKNGEYLVLGISDNAYYSANTAILIDDMKVVEVPLDNTVSAWVQADKKYGTTETNLVFTVDDGNGGTKEKSFMRIGATYTTDDAENFSTVLIGGKAYTIKQRGMMLGEKGADMYVSKQEDGSYVANNVIGSTSYSGTMSEQYWLYDEEKQTVSYTMAVTFSKTSKEMALATRSYMVVDYNGQDAIMYTDTIDTVTVNGEARDLSGQSIYESACELNNTIYGWFTE